MGPQRVVSLVPSLTELICWLGARERLVGRTKFCDEPGEVLASVPAVGGTKDPAVESIVALAPGLVIANREENRREDVEALRAAGIDVLVTDPSSVDGAMATVVELGAILGCGGRAAVLVEETRGALAEVRAGSRPRVFVAVWKRPFMGLGGDSYGHDLIERSGAVNVLAGRPRYPEVTLTELRGLGPDLVLLPDEPYRFREEDAALFEDVAPARVVDGRLLWWYGPRMPAAIRELSLIFGEVGR